MRIYYIYKIEIVKYLYNEKPNWVNGDFVKVGMPRKENIPYYTERILSKLPDDKVYMICLAANGQMDGKYISSKTGQICDTKEELKKLLYEEIRGKKIHYMWFDNNIAANNCKLAMRRPLLRFSLLKLQSNQSLTKIHYQYIPNIKWENVKSDYDILSACNCPENKIKEYLEYVNTAIQEADRKKP